MKKRLSVILAVMLVLLSVSACQSKTEPKGQASEGQGTAAAENKAEEGKKEWRVAYVTPGGTGDNGFTDSVVSGIERIGQDFGAKTTVVECNNDAAKYSQAVEQTFQWKPDVVFADSYGFEELYAQYADKYPDIKVINLDFELENEKKTISYVTFINEEGSFLAGALSAMVTTAGLEFSDDQKVVGFMGGKDIPVIRSFQFGFEQGVKYIDPEIKVVSTYTGDFFDPVKGKQAAKQLFAQGADIVFQAAGRTGIGALEAANEEGKYAIGVDSNQNGLYPGHVVASMVKDLGGAAYQIFSDINDGSYVPATHYENGAGEGGVYLALDEHSEKALNADIINKVKEIEQKISAGEITVEKYQAEE